MSLPRFLFRDLASRLRKLYGRSIYGALLLVVFVGLAVPAVVGGFFLIGVLYDFWTLNDQISVRNARAS